MTKLTHFDETGRAAMVDVSAKPMTTRTAIAQGWIKMHPNTLRLATSDVNKKGDVRHIAELAGIMGAKQTAALIPLCHPLPLSKVAVKIDIDDQLPGMRITAQTKTNGQTGVEMEALTAVSITCLTIYDMLKAAEKGIEIGGICLSEKTGGASGYWSATEATES